MIKHFGSVAALKKASVKRIEEVAGFGPMLAKTAHDYLHPDEKSPEPNSDVGPGEQTQKQANKRLKPHLKQCQRVYFCQ